VQLPEGIPVAFPPFIPSSLKTLSLIMIPLSMEPLLCQLPSMLQASGASLEEFHMWSLTLLTAEGPAALGRIFRVCSATLKVVRLEGRPYHALDPTVAPEIAPALSSCCEGLERLKVPWGGFHRLHPPAPPSTASPTSISRMAVSRST
jgi:hypothetical protein